MRTYKLVIAYDGSRYKGWQRQSNTELTIQGILEHTLSEICGYSVEVNGSGRTDGGVHAEGQTASIVLAGKIDEQGMLMKLQERLPADICVKEIVLVKNGFHARYNAKGKYYQYVVDTRKNADVFQRKYSGHFPHRLNIEAMQKAVSILQGEHDFAGFTDKVDERSTVRIIYKIEIEQKEDKVYLSYLGNGFMYHMVRILTGTLLEIGAGMRSVESVSQVFQSGLRRDAGFLAPAEGLFLMQVYYTKDEMKKRVAIE